MHEPTEWGWNIMHERPATRDESFKESRTVCQCPLCSIHPHYSDYYCGREKAEGYIKMLENYWWSNA